MEQWARIPGPLSHKYCVSTEGRVYSLTTNKIIRQSSPNPKQPKYKQVRLTQGRKNLVDGGMGRRKKYIQECWMVHRLVCATFYPDLYTDDCEIHHRNFDPSDNRLENLRIVSPKDHKALHKRIKRAVRNAKMRAIERYRVDHPVSPHPSKPIGDPTKHQTKFIF